MHFWGFGVSGLCSLRGDWAIARKVMLSRAFSRGKGEQPIKVFGGTALGRADTQTPTR